jgi:hypothetical protein
MKYPKYLLYWTTTLIAALVITQTYIYWPGKICGSHAVNARFLEN